MVSNRIGTAYSYCARICARAQMHSFENAFHGFSCFHEYQNEFIFSGMHLFFSELSKGTGIFYPHLFSFECLNDRGFFSINKFITRNGKRCFQLQLGLQSLASWWQVSLGEKNQANSRSLWLCIESTDEIYWVWEHYDTHILLCNFSVVFIHTGVKGDSS